MRIEEFIEARLDEDEALAQECSPAPWKVNDESYPEYILDGEGNAHVSGGRWGGEARIFDCDEDALHIARHDPAHVLRQCAALRELFDRAKPERECRGHPGPWMPCGDYGPGYCQEPHEADDLCVIASIWSEHPDFREEWKL